MYRRILTGATLAGCALLPVSPVSANDAVSRCELATVIQDDATGSSHQGVLTGFVAAVSGGPVAISCVITVNGVTQVQLPTVAGTAVAATARDISFSAEPTDIVYVCTDATNHGVTTRTGCHLYLPPRLPSSTGLAEQLWPIVDPPTCFVLATLAGDHGAVDIGADGDVYLGGKRIYDCLPYAL